MLEDAAQIRAFGRMEVEVAPDNEQEKPCRTIPHATCNGTIAVRHSYVLEGYAFRLRPVEDADARFILDLRQGQPYMNIGAQTLDEQLHWLQEYYARADDYYFIIETRQGRRPVGTTGLNDFDHSRSGAVGQ